jgi:hypothetical protein
MSGLPAIGRAYGGSYRAVWSQTAGGPPADKDPVCVTMAGPFHIADDRSAAISQALLRYFRQMTSAREALGTAPFTVPNINVALSDVLESQDPEVLRWPSAVSVHESPFIRVSPQTRPYDVSGSLGLLSEANFNTLEEYLLAITAVTTPQHPTTVLAYRDPRALLRTIDHLGVTSELVLKRPLVSKPAMARSALLATEAHSHSDLQSCLSALGEVIAELRVPGNSPNHAAGRLKAWLVRNLPNLDKGGEARVQDAIDLLDAVRRIRNSGQHPKPDRRLIAAHELLSLPFPIQDPANAWDIIRAQMDTAFRTLQEEIFAGR